MDIVRPARPEDADDCANVHVQAWREAYVGMIPDEILANLSIERRVEQWRDWLADPGRGAFVIERGRRVVGFCLAGPSLHGSAPGFGEIQAIYLLAEVYGQGLADQLMALGAAWLADHGWTGVTLRVMEGNGRARAFYERLGGIAHAGGDHEVQGILVRDVEYRWPNAATLAQGAS